MNPSGRRVDPFHENMAGGTGVVELPDVPGQVGRQISQKGVVLGTDGDGGGIEFVLHVPEQEQGLIALKTRDPFLDDRLHGLDAAEQAVGHVSPRLLRREWKREHLDLVGFTTATGSSQNEHRIGGFCRKTQRPEVLAELGPVGRKDPVGEERKKLLAQVNPAQVRELQEREESLLSGFSSPGNINKVSRGGAEARGESDRSSRNPYSAPSASA